MLCFPSGPGEGQPAAGGMPGAFPAGGLQGGDCGVLLRLRAGSAQPGRPCRGTLAGREERGTLPRKGTPAWYCQLAFPFLAVLPVQLRSRCQQLDASSLLPSLELHALAPARACPMRFVSVVSVVSVVALVSVVSLCSLVHHKRSFAGKASHSRNGLLMMHQAIPSSLFPEQRSAGITPFCRCTPPASEVYLLLEHIAQVQVGNRTSEK